VTCGTDNRTVDFTGISGVSNTAHFAFRIVAEFDRDRWMPMGLRGVDEQLRYDPHQSL
jgi:hypothetical protein